MIDELSKYQILLSPEGRADLVNTMRSFQNSYGADWLNEFKTANPDLVVVVSLIANFNATDAALKFKEYVGGQIDDIENFLVRMVTRETVFKLLDDNPQALAELHRAIRAEIDKPRF
jgi:hypothetical protein